MIRAYYIILLSLILSPVFSQTMVEYLSPCPGAMYVNAETNLILRTKMEWSYEKIKLLGQTVIEGSHSGVVESSVLVDTDKKTAVLKFIQPFSPGEEVNVRFHPDLIQMPANSDHSEYKFHISENERVPILDVSSYHHPKIKKGSPADFPEIQTTIYGEIGEGDIFMSPAGSSPYKLFVLDNNGDPKFFIEDEPVVRYSDFKVVSDTLLAYFRQAPGGIPPTHYIMNSNYSVIDSFSAGNGQISDIHDFKLIKDGTRALILIYDRQTIDMSQIVAGGHPSATVLGVIIQEVDNKQNVYFEWRSWDHFNITDGISNSSTTLMDYTSSFINYTHANSLDVDSEGNIIISNRNMHEVTKINRNTGEIIWRLGGLNNDFTFINDTLGFTDQHHASFLEDDNRITIFDNGSWHTPPTTRAVEYLLDETNMTVELVWQYQNPYSDQAGALGSVQRLPNGNTYISWGGVSAPYVNPIQTEVDADNNIVFELSFLEGDLPNNLTYRAFRYQPEKTSTSIEPEITLASAIVNCFPNPANDQISFQFQNPNENIKFSIVDQTGKLVESIVLKNNIHDKILSFDLSQYDNGIYFYTVWTKRGAVNGKFLVIGGN